MPDRVTVLLAAGGEPWEARALQLLNPASPVLKRCVDLTDLLATAATGQADVAVVSADLAGLDADAVVQLLRHDVRCVAVGDDGAAALTRIGIADVVPANDLSALPEAVVAAGTRDVVADPTRSAGSHPSRQVPAG